VESGSGDRMMMDMVWECLKIGYELTKVEGKTKPNYFGFLYCATTISLLTIPQLSSIDMYTMGQIRSMFTHLAHARLPVPDSAPLACSTDSDITTAHIRATPASPARILTIPATAAFLFPASAQSATVLDGAGADAVVVYITLSRRTSLRGRSVVQYYVPDNTGNHVARDPLSLMNRELASCVLCSRNARSTFTSYG